MDNKNGIMFSNWCWKDGAPKPKSNRFFEGRSSMDNKEVIRFSNWWLGKANNESWWQNKSSIFLNFLQENPLFGNISVAVIDENYNIKSIGISLVPFSNSKKVVGIINNPTLK